MRDSKLKRSTKSDESMDRNIFEKKIFLLTMELKIKIDSKFLLTNFYININAFQRFSKYISHTCELRIHEFVYNFKDCTRVHIQYSFKKPMT